MLVTLLFIFILIFTLTFIDSKSKYVEFISYILITFILFYLAAFRGSGVDRDYDTYISAFNGDNISNAIFEPTFILFTYFIKTFLRSNTIFLFIFYSYIGVIIKSVAIKKISNFYFWSLLLYFSYFFTLHEMTQIRIGAACSLFLLSIPYLYQKNIKIFLLLSLLAFILHFSAIILLILIFIDPYKLKKYTWLGILLFSILFGIFFKTTVTYIFENFNFGLLQNKILAYQNENNNILNIFNFWMIFRITLIILLIYKSEILITYNKYSFLLIKIYIISISSYYILSFNPAFAGRFNDLFGIVEIVLFPLMIYLFKPNYIAKFLLLFFASTLIFLNLFYLKLII